MDTDSGREKNPLPDEPRRRRSRSAVVALSVLISTGLGGWDGATRNTAK
ncbi:hypothetical protein [Planobispora takensis]|uniref:Uncharacterized protein n=1 Tax=Planobispora takensis TaxID=1367882 RepID=A0A8J3SWS2_9ACTN|nr:hypothetical protein [Planobispora takensis]GIH99759.1 hypothetical protein Pta02_17680 [Planobispora takensis]